MLKRNSAICGPVAACLALGLLALIWATPAVAQAPSGTLTRVTTGSAPIRNQNIPSAKEKAVTQALETAVQTAVAQLVSPQVLAANLEFLYEQILPKAQEYLVTFRVLGGVENKGEYRVGVESTIQLGLLEQTLTQARILHSGTGMPRLLFLIAEQTPEALLPRYWWGQHPEPYISMAESGLASRMLEQRFPLVGQGEERPDPAQYNIRFTTIYDTEAALNLGRKLGADMVILGRAQVSEAINRMGDEKAFDARINLELYATASGEKVGDSQTQAAAKSDLEQEGAGLAMAKAVDLAALDIQEKLNTYWTRNLRKESRFDLVIQGEGEFLPRYLALKDRFREMQDIENFQPKEMGADRAVLELVYKGSPALFADTVMLKTFEGFGLEVEVASEELVTLRFIEKAPVLPLEITLDGDAGRTSDTTFPEINTGVDGQNPKKEGQTP